MPDFTDLQDAHNHYKSCAEKYRDAVEKASQARQAREKKKHECYVNGYLKKLKESDVPMSKYERWERDQLFQENINVENAETIEKMERVRYDEAEQDVNFIKKLIDK